MKKKYLVTFLTVVGTLAVLFFWLKPRTYSCQRCGAGLRMCGPLIVGVAQHYMSGAGGDKGLYCKRNGHEIVKKYDPEIKMTDWMYHEDSYDRDNEINSVDLMRDLGN